MGATRNAFDFLGALKGRRLRGRRQSWQRVRKEDGVTSASPWCSAALDRRAWRSRTSGATANAAVAICPREARDARHAADERMSASVNGPRRAVRPLSYRMSSTVAPDVAVLGSSRRANGLAAMRVRLSRA